MSESQAASGEDRPRHARIRLATLLVGGVTLLILLAVGSVLWITLSSATRNTFELLGERATNTLDILEARVDSELLSVTVAIDGLAAQFADGRLNLENRRATTFDTLSGFLTSHPQTRAAVIVTSSGDQMAMTREEGYAIEVPPNAASDQRRELALELSRNRQEPFWATPVWVPEINEAVLTYIAPIWRGDELFGSLIAPVTITEISKFLLDVEEQDMLSAFILHNRDRVLAHPRMSDIEVRPTSSPRENPLPRIVDFPEPAFSLLSGGGEEALLVLEFAANVSNARVNDDTIIITRDTDKFGPDLWTLGVALERAIVGREVNRLINTAIIGLVILVLAMLAGIVFARHLNRQIGGIVTSASALTRLEVANALTVPDSRITELSDAAQAFNRMIGALRLFETYVPKQLVLGLMQRGETIEASEERVLTIMFTDIRGFSTIAEHMDASEIAQLLNTHFEMLASAIEAEGGTVDKYIGDAIMAFWGAPEDLPDHAARAMRAAAEIHRRVREDNIARRAAGQSVLAVRVGVHTGPVVVGNIGSSSRVNYTVVGDTVNTASRLDSLAKEVAGDEDCIVLISGVVRDQAGDAAVDGITLTSLGERDIRGREGTISVYRLDAEESSG